MKRLLITTGDPDGVGSEVSCKALETVGPQKNVQFVLFRSPECSPLELKRIDKKFRRITVSDGKLLPTTNSHRDLIDVISEQPPARWVEMATRYCLAKVADGIVTAPISKTGIAAAGLKDRGHTEIFSRLCKTKDIYMAFRGQYFNVLLLTDHIPLNQVAKALTPQRVQKGLLAAERLRSILGLKKPLALVGLNPHAGEDGLLGTEDQRLAPFLKKCKAQGPLVPDTAFFKQNWSKYSVFVCCYHDQGLIPFKLVHGFDEGVHLTLGLPFVRTSVDHGTAKDLFGLNRAKSGSMRDALKLAVRLIS
jgi:4-hydroxythreonine-4-phosphate dehydrogenase